MGKKSIIKIINISMFLGILFITSNDTYARGCNIPYRECPSTSQNPSDCVWKDKISCGYCNRNQCITTRGCRWSGFLIKRCMSDFSTGRDA